jgi:hypothetical protein
MAKAIVGSPSLAKEQLLITGFFRTCAIYHISEVDFFIV